MKDFTASQMSCTFLREETLEAIRDSDSINHKFILEKDSAKRTEEALAEVAQSTTESISEGADVSFEAGEEEVSSEIHTAPGPCGPWVLLFSNLRSRL